MIDQANPRSLLFQLEALKGHIDNLPDTSHTLGLSPQGRCLLEALSVVQLADLNELVVGDQASGSRVKLEQVLGTVQKLLGRTATLISDKYFDHHIEHQQLVTDRWEDE